MNLYKIKIDNLLTERLLLIPYTKEVCKNLIHGDFSDLTNMGLKRGRSWPDQDVLETLPKILSNLNKVDSPTGFESWMIVKIDTLEIIGDLGFKGLNNGNIDLGYGIINEERRKGYAEEAAKALINWVLPNMLVKKITASCSIDNVGSINLLKKLNFKETNRDFQMIYWILINSKW